MGLVEIGNSAVTFWQLNIWNTKNRLKKTSKQSRTKNATQNKNQNSQT